jgi:outer membrane protein
VQRPSRIFLGLSLLRGIGFSCVLSVYPAWAQTSAISASPSASMDALARTVVETNSDIVTQRQQVKIAEARLAAAKAGFLPTIEANGLVQKREIDVKNGGTGDAKFIAGQASVEARLRVYDGNRNVNAVQVAKAELASAQAILDASISDTLLELLTSAADVHLDRKVRHYTQLQSDAIGEQLGATTRRLEFGESTRTDENLAKARLATSQAGILAATEELNVSGYRFRAVSGQSATIVPPLPALAALPASLMQAQSLAVLASPRLRAAQRNADAGRTGVYFAAGALMPHLDAVGGYEYLTGGVANLFSGRLPDDRSAVYGGIELRVPVFQPRDYAEIRRARAVRDQRLAQTDTAARTLTGEVATAWTRWQSAKGTILAAEAAVAAIEQAAEGIKKESIGGNRTLAEVLDAQNELLSARVALERAVRNEFVARAGLLAATQGLRPESILEGNAISRTSVSSRPEVSSLGRKAADPARTPPPIATEKR